MLEPRETEDCIKGLMAPFILASICRDRLLRSKPNYTEIDPNKDFDTGFNIDSIPDIWRLHLSRTKDRTTDPIELLCIVSSALPTYIEKTCSFYTLDQKNITRGYQGYYNLIGSTEVTAYDGWRDGKSIEFFRIEPPSSLEKSDLSVLHTLYEFGFSGEEERFIQNNSHLIPFLKEAKESIEKIYDQDCTTVLHYLKDDEEDSEVLFIVLRTALTTDENLSLLRKLDDKWWLDVPYSIRKVVSLDVVSE